MELAEYIQLARKWFLLLLLAAFIGGGVSFITNSGRPSFYTASALVSIGRYIDSPNPNSAEITLGQNLARTYAQLIRTNEVLQGAIDTLGLSFSPQQLSGLFTTNIIEGTSLLQITARTTDPVLTADIANAVAEQLIRRSPTNLTAGQQAQIDYATSQIEALDQQLQQQRESLASIDTQLENATDPQEIARLNDQRAVLTGQITQAAAAIAQFQSTTSSIQARTNALDLVERAIIPTFAQSSSTATAVLLGAMIGIALAGGGGYF